MSQESDIRDAIVENATGPKRVRGDSGEIEQHSLPEQIAALQQIADDDAAKTPRRGLRFTKIISPGPVG